MNIEGINWDEVPETLSLEQLYKLIHVSKGIAQLLLVSKIPCVINDNATHKYTVKKRDLIKYLGTHLGTLLATGDFDHHGTIKNDQTQLI